MYYQCQKCLYIVKVSDDEKELVCPKCGNMGKDRWFEYPVSAASGFLTQAQVNVYGIIKDFLRKYPYIEDNINNKSNNSVCCDLVLKYKNNFAIWNVVEVLSFGDFIKLYEMYYQQYNTSGNINNYLWSVKFLRNAAAHNNCLINSLKKP